MSPEEGFRSPRPGTGEHLRTGGDASRGVRLKGSHSVDLVGVQSQMMKILTDAEAAANSAAIQLVSFKDELEEKVTGKRADRQHLTRQRGLLLERLEDFRRVNKTVRQKLKQLQHAESCRLETDRQIDELMKRIMQAEKENQLLKCNLVDTERRMEELTGRRQEEQEKMRMVVHKARTVEATQTHLQTQVWNKEAEKDGLALQLRTLERTVAEQKAEIEHLNGVISALNQKALLDRELLKKANRAQRLRTERFEAAIQKCSAQLKKKDVQLASVCSERDDRRRLTEQTTEEKEQVEAQIAVLKREVAALTSRLQREKDQTAAASAQVTQQLDKTAAENQHLRADNSSLKAGVSELEQQLTDCETALIHEKLQSQDRKWQAEQCQQQVTQLEAEVSGLRVKYSLLLEDTSAAQEGRGRRVEQVEGQSKLLMSSEEMGGSVQAANAKLQEEVGALHHRVEHLCQERSELEAKLRAQEETLSCSRSQLDDRTAACRSLGRQLEAALQDVERQVEQVSQQAASREEALQLRLLELEAARSRQENQLSLLQQSKVTVEKRLQLRVKDLQLSLERSESSKQNIQRFVDLLKNSYLSMSAQGT